MPNVIVPLPRFYKQNWPRAEINGNVSLAKDLSGVWAFDQAGTYQRNLVTRTAGTFNGDAKIVSAQGGLSLSVTPGGTGYFDTGYTGPTGGGPATYFVLGMTRNLPSGSGTSAVGAMMSQYAIVGNGIELDFGNAFGSSSAVYATGSTAATTAWWDGAKNAAVNPLTGVSVTTNQQHSLSAYWSANPGPSKNLEFGRSRDAGTYFILDGWVFAGYCWSRQLNDSEHAWLGAEPYALIRPDVRRTYFYAAAAPTSPPPPPPPSVTYPQIERMTRGLLRGVTPGMAA